MASARRPTGGCANLRYEDGMTRWEVWRGGEPWAELALPMAGEHNALNATAAAALAAGQGVPWTAIVEALASFKSVKRRLEVRAEVGGVTIIDDFAHHPTAIRETLRALRTAYPARAHVGGAGAALEHAAAQGLRAGAGREPARWPIAWCWPASSSSSAFRKRSGCIRKQVVWRAERSGHAGGAVRRCGRDRGRASHPSWRPATWWRSSRTAASTASTRSCRRALPRCAASKAAGCFEPVYC